MTEHDSEDEEAEAPWKRSTAPQSPYTGREIGLGIAVALVGFLIAFGLPLALV
ncbi:MAG: hypothetical protein ABEH66_07430 [Halobacteriales archaeon]